MSCIPKLLELKGDKEFLPVHDNIVIEGGGKYKDYDYLITFVDYGHRCGYVAIPPLHPVYNDKSDYPHFSVHGGITFFEESRFAEELLNHKCADKWIGFDACHGDDRKDMAC